MHKLSGKKRRHRWMLPMLIGAALSAGCSLIGSEDRTGIQGIERTLPLQVGDRSLPDAVTGDPVALRGRPGQLLVLYFGYTHCPDVCPTTMSDLEVAIGDLEPAERARVQVALATVDPERDGGEDLRRYVQHFFPQGLALRTTDDEEAAAVHSLLGVVAEIAPHAPGEDYAVVHSAVVYGIDEQGTVVVEWPFGSAPSSIAADLRTLLARLER